MAQNTNRGEGTLAKLGSILGSVLAGIFVLGLTLNSCARSIETIPDNAKVLVNDKTKEWLPDSQKTLKKLGTDRLQRDWHASTWKEARESDYELPSGWENYWENYKSGRDVGLVQERLFPGQKRWNKDGSWNY